MAISLLVQEVQIQLPQLLNRLDSGALDKVVIEEYQLLDPAEENRVTHRVRQRFREAIGELVPYAVFLAADPGGATRTIEDAQSDYQEPATIYAADLYKFVAWLRWSNTCGYPETASAEMTFPAAGASALIDGETFTLSDFNAVNTEVFEFDIGGGGVTPGNTAIVLTGTENVPLLRQKVRTAINNNHTGIRASFYNSGLLLVQSGPGADGNVATSETVADPGFILTNFTGGVNNGHGILIKRSKNDASPRAALLSRKQAQALKL